MRWRSRLAAVAVSAALVVPFAATTALAQDGSNGSEESGPPSFQGFLGQPPNFPFGQDGFFPPPFTEGFFGENPPPPFTEGFFADRPAPPFQAGFLPPPFAAFFGQDGSNGEETNGEETNGEENVETQTVLNSLFGN